MRLREQAELDLSKLSATDLANIGFPVQSFQTPMFYRWANF
jgi:hypothetical protein